jgi:Protein of unknown function (DUF3040)
LAARGAAVLSLNEREQRILSRIAEELHKTAPVLVSLLNVFNRLVADEQMPSRRPLRRIRRRLSTATLTWGFVSTWSFMTLGMITVALVMSHVSHGA